LLTLPAIQIDGHQHEGYDPVFPYFCQDCDPEQEHQKYLSAVGKCSPYPSNEQHCQCQDDYPSAKIIAYQGRWRKVGEPPRYWKMDKWQTTSHVERIRREIAEIQAANQIYKSQVAHTSAQIADHEKRQIRLQEIKGELKILSGQSAD
jgi:hypothetical protein